MGKDLKYRHCNSLSDKGDNGSEIDLHEDFCTFWEDEERDSIKASESIEQEEAPKLIDDSWISFNNESPDIMIDSFDIEEMTFMLESGKPSEDGQNQETSSFQGKLSSTVESCTSIDDREDTNVRINRPDRRMQIKRKKITFEEKPCRSKSPPRKRRAPNNSTVPSLELPNASKSYPCPVSSHITEVIETQQKIDQFGDRYNTLMHNLTVSMRQTELTRAQVFKLQRNFRCSPNKKNPVVNKSLSAFLSGTRSTITSGLEQSRRQLQVYMAQMKNCNMMF